MKVKTITSDKLEGYSSEEEGFLFVMPTTEIDMAERSAALMSSRAGIEGSILIVLDTARKGFIHIANRVFEQSDSQYFGYVAQDAFAGRGWLRLAADTLNQKDGGLFAFNDGKWHGLLAAFGMVRRSWAESNYSGKLFYPDYQRHYGDAELTLIAKSDHKLCYHPASVLVEVDWEKDTKAVDIEDKQLFNQRKESLFEGRVSDERYCHILSRKKSVS
jgi:hypothetical protein